MKKLTPLYTTTAIVHAVAIASRFDQLAARIPTRAAVAILAAQFPLLLVEGWFESHVDHGMENFPLWMRIKSRAMKASFTFGFIYLVIVALQTWNVSLGPIDPTPPPQWPQLERAGWFAMFTLGMSFVFYLAAAGQLIPALRAITRPLKNAPAVVAVPILSAVGVAAGWGAASLVAWKAGAAAVGRVNATLAAFQSNPAIALAITAGMVWGPIVLGWLLSRGEEEAVTPSETPPAA